MLGWPSTHTKRLDFVRQVRAIRATDDNGPTSRLETLVEFDANPSRHFAEHGVRRRVVKHLRDDAFDQVERLVIRVLGCGRAGKRRAGGGG